MRVEYSPGYYPLNLLKIILYVYLGKEGFYKKLGFMRMRTAMAIFQYRERAIESGLVDEA